MSGAKQKAQDIDDAFDIQTRYVRVTGRRTGFVEFEFSVGEPEIFLEMILSESAFKEFCELNKVAFIDGTEGHAAAGRDVAWAWRLSDATEHRLRDSDRAGNAPKED